MPMLMALMRARMNDTRDERHFTTFYDADHYNTLLYGLSTKATTCAATRAMAHLIF